MKYRTTSNSGTGLAGCITILIILAISMTVGGFCWKFAINEWLEYAGKEPSVKFWHGALISLVPHLGGLSVAAAVLTWIIMLFL